MIRRIQFHVHREWLELAMRQFANAIQDMLEEKPLYVTIEREPQYELLRSKLAKRAAKKRRARKLGYSR